MSDGVTELIIQWAKERGLHNADPKNQMIKLVEEMGELADGLNKNKQNQVIDSIGDMYVVLTILSMQLNINVEDCINHAYDEIKDRKGEMVNGVFLKASDLKEGQI